MLGIILRVAVALYGLMFVYIGVGIHIDPANVMTMFNLVAPDASGISAVRADMGAFFIFTGTALTYGAWKAHRHWLLSGLLLVVLAFIGRAIGLLAMPGNDQITQSMTIEAVGIILAGAALHFAARPRESGSA